MITTVATRKNFLPCKTSINPDNNIDKRHIRIGLMIVDTTELSFWKHTEDDWDRQLRELNKEPHRVVWSNPIELKKIDKPLRHWGKWMHMTKGDTSQTPLKLSLPINSIKKKR